MGRRAVILASLGLLLHGCSDPVDLGSGDATAGGGGEAAQSSMGSGGAPIEAGGAAGVAGAATDHHAGETSNGGSEGVGDHGGEGGGGDGVGGDAGGAGGAGGNANQVAFACIERGSLCDTTDDCLVGEFCVEGSCAPGTPLGAACTGEEYCGRDVRCVQGLCTYKYSLFECGADPQMPYTTGPDPWLACAPGTYCSSGWTPVSAFSPPYCYPLGTADRWCGTEPCAPGFFCRASGPGLPYDYPVYRCAERIPPGPTQCLMDAPDECQAGYVCNWVVSPDQLDAHQPGDPVVPWYGCVPPGKEGDYCNPWYPYTYYYPDQGFPSECGPNLYCSDEASPDAATGLVDPHGRCVPLPEPTVPTCETQADCASGEVCRDFYLGFKTCGALPQEGDHCHPGERYACADDLQCLFAAYEFFPPRSGYCTRVADLGNTCDDDTLCSDDGACVAQ